MKSYILSYLLLFSSLSFAQELTLFVETDSICINRIGEENYSCQLSKGKEHRIIGAIDQEIETIYVDASLSSISLFGSGNIVNYAVELSKISDSEYHGELALGWTPESDLEMEFAFLSIDIKNYEMLIYMPVGDGFLRTQRISISSYLEK